MNKPVRVLCVFSSLNRGGAESMCMNLYRNIDRSNVQFDFVKHTHEKCDFENEIITLGGRIYEAPKYKIYNHFQYVAWWKEFLNKHKEYKIVHGHFYTIAKVYFAVAKKMGRITISHCHSTSVRGSGINDYIKRFYIYNISSYSDFRFACSRRAGEWLYGSKRFKVIKNAIDTRQFAFSEEKRKIIRDEFGLKDEFVVGHVGNFAPVKNHSFLVDVFKTIHDNKPDSKLIMVGGNDRTDIEEKVKCLELSDSVIFTGARNDVSDILQAFDVFVFPSVSEGLPVTVVEAQATGLKCFLSEAITTDVDLTGICTFLPIDDPRFWADKILNADLTKADTYEQIKKAGYDIHTAAKQMERFYLRINDKYFAK